MEQHGEVISMMMMAMDSAGTGGCMAAMAAGQHVINVIMSRECQMPIDDLQRAGWIKKEREGYARGSEGMDKVWWLQEA